MKKNKPLRHRTGQSKRSVRHSSHAVTTVLKPNKKPVATEKEEVIIKDEWMDTLFKKPSTYFVIAGVVLALLLGKMYFAPKPMQQTSLNTSYAFPKNSKDIPKAITLRPANASDLQLYVTEGLTPLQMKDLVTYQRNGGLMILNSRDLSSSAIRNKGLDEVDALLEGKKDPDMNLISIAFFAKPGGSGAIGIMGELSDVSYPGVDVSRAFITTFAQSLYPNIFVHVYAKKGSEYIELSKRISEPSMEEEYINFCNAAAKEKDSKESLDCYWSMLSSDATLLQKARETSKELVNTFAIKAS